MAVATQRPQTPLAGRSHAPGTAAAVALAEALAGIGDRWSLAIVAQLAHGPQRFSDLASAVAPIARTVLSERLRRLSDLGVVGRRQYSDSPVRCNYRLTLAGAELARVCGVLADWSSCHLGNGDHVLAHAGCDAHVQPAYQCERCGDVAARDVTSRSGPSPA